MGDLQNLERLIGRTCGNTLIGDLDLEHRLTVTKSRCSALADQVFQSGRAGDAARLFLDWLDDGEPLAAREDVDAVVAMFDQISEGPERATAKNLCVEAFGKPATWTVQRAIEARAWLEERLAQVNAEKAEPELDGKKAKEAANEAYEKQNPPKQEEAE